MSKASCESPDKLSTTYESKIKESGKAWHTLLAQAGALNWTTVQDGKERRPPTKMPDEEMSGNIDNQSHG